jgi:outer membrane protein
MKKYAALRQKALSISAILSLIIASTTIFTPVTIAQENDPVSEEQAKQSDPDDLPPLPLSPIEKAERDGTALRVSLEDITKLALQYNLDIAIQDTYEQTNQEKIKQTFGSYDPKLTAQLGLNSSKSANTSQYDLSAERFRQSDYAQWNFSFTQPVKTGGTLTAQWNSRRTENNSNSAVFNPSYNSSLSIQFSQPLWRNLKIDSNRSQIKIANLDFETSDSQFKQKVTDTIANIQTNYWDLVAAIRNYEIRRNSVELAQINLRDNRKKVEVGTLAPIEVTDAEANVASREVDLIGAEETILRAENTLRSLISSDRNSAIWSQVIVPTDEPDFEEYKVNVSTAIETALKNRPELEQARISLRKLDIQRRLNENNRKWQFDLTAQYGSSGTAGPQGCQKNQYTGECELYDPVTGLPSLTGEPRYLTPDALVGGLGASYKTMFTEGFTNWQVAFQVEIPLRNRSLDAQIAQQNIQKRRELMQIRQTEQTVQVDVRNAIQALETNRKQVETAEVARKLAEDRLRGEEKRFNAGLSQNYLVLQRQNEVSTAQYQELQALIRYKQAIITLQKAMYTLIESNQFEIAKDSSNDVASLEY